MKVLENKNAVITGGSDGIGLGIAKAFAQNGANLLLIGKDPNKLQKPKRSFLVNSLYLFTPLLLICRLLRISQR